MRCLFRNFLPALVAGCMFATAHAQDALYPSKTVSLVVPFPPGGVVDVIGRLIAARMQRELKGTIVVENKPGAGGTLGAGLVARSRPDGYTLLLGGSATHVFGPAIYPKLNYQPSELVPIGQISNGPLVIVVGSNSKATDMPSLLAELQAAGGGANFASNGNGTFPQLAGELFNQANRLTPVHVPYNGGPAVITALMRGDVSFSINHIPVVQGMVRSGKLRAIATTGAKRAAAFPDLPTVAETGHKDFEANAWFGLFVPAGTPPAVQKALSDALAASLDDKELRDKLLAQGDARRPIGMPGSSVAI